MKREGAPVSGSHAALEQEDKGSAATRLEESLASAERKLLGETLSGHVKLRIERLEEEMYGTVQCGGLKSRMQMLEREL